MSKSKKRKSNGPPTPTNPTKPKGKGAAIPRKTPPPAAVADITGMAGLAVLADKTGTHSDQVLAVLAFLLCGTAGSEAWLGDRWRGMALPKLDLLVRTEDRALVRLVDLLTSHVRAINRDLAASMARFSPEIVAVMLQGAFVGGRPAKIASQEDTALALERHRQALDRPSFDGVKSLLEDLNNTLETHNIEASLHPEFLIEHTNCRDLDAALERCHQRSAIVLFPTLDSSRGPGEPVGSLRRLRDLMAGAAPVEQPVGPGRSPCLPLKAHAVIAAGPEDLARMAEHVAGMPGQFLWLATEQPTGTGGQSGRPAATADAGSVEILMQAFCGALKFILGERRGGRTPVIEFEAAAEEAFDKRMDDYREWIRTLAPDPADDPGPVARELPAMLYWALGFLCQKLPNGTAKPGAEERLAASFDAAKRLVESHSLRLREFLHKDQLRQWMSLAERIMEEVGTRAPLRHRDLVRSFNCQRKERFQPVIDALLAVGVLQYDPEGAFTPGEADLADRKEEFVKSLLAGCGKPTRDE